MTVALVVFWVCLTVCVYIYFGYPLLLWIVSRVRTRPVAADEGAFPSVTFVIAAYNEESVIAKKIENTLGLDYPADKLEVLVVSNGSKDRTDEIVRACTDPRVRLIALPQPGKMEAINEGARAASGEILVFTDADFLLDMHALRAMTSKYADPAVGGVCGARKTSVARGGDTTGEGEGMYARWDKWQKIRESRIGSVFAADGLLYSVRRSLYVPVTNPAQSDDMAVSMRVPLQGYRLLYEENATAWEEASVEATSEFRRKIRVTNHSVSALLNLRGALVTSGFYSVEVLSHKLIRHFIPYFLVPLLIASAVLAHSGAFYLLALAGQLLVYGLAIAGALLRNTGAGRLKCFTVPYYFCFVNGAAFFGILTMLRGHRTQAWSTRDAARMQSAKVKIQN